jgi:hypothetical protein
MPRYAQTLYLLKYKVQRCPNALFQRCWVFGFSISLFLRRTAHNHMASLHSAKLDRYQHFANALRFSKVEIDKRENWLR